MEKIEKGKYSFKNPVWQTVSETAKDFVSYLLTYEASARPDAAQALEHAWIKQIKQQLSHKNIEEQATMVMDNLLSFNKENKLRHTVYAFIAS